MKQVFTLTDFSGGINNISSIEDINNKQVATADDVNFGSSANTNGGLLSSTGQSSTISLSLGPSNASIEPGYGLFFFASDFKILSDNNIFNINIFIFHS